MFSVGLSLCLALAQSLTLAPTQPPADDSRIEQAKDYLASGQLEQARGLLGEVVKANPANSEAHHLLGVAYMRARQFNESIPHLEKAVELSPGSPEALNDLGSAYLEVHQRDKAMQALARSLALKPDQPTTHYSLGMLFLETRNYGQAALHLEQARNNGLKHSGVLSNLGRAYLGGKRLDDALEVFSELPPATRTDWQVQFELGKMLFENFFYDDAKEKLSQAWGLNPGSYEVGFHLALVNYLLGEQPESLKILLEMKAKGAKILELDNLLGAVYAKLGRLDEAEKVLRETIEEAPGQPDAFFNLGLILLEQGRRQEAEALLERGGGLYAGNAKVLYILGTQQACSDVHQRLAEGTGQGNKAGAPSDRAAFYLQIGKVFQERFHHTTAAELLRIAWELDPDKPETLLALGISCYNLDALSASLAFFRRAISLRRDLAQAHYFLGNNYASLGKDTEAVEAYRRAIRLVPQNAIYHYRLGKVLFRDGQTDEALTSFQKALSLSPEDASTHFAIGKLYLRLRKEAQAVSEFREAMQLNPGLPEPYYYLAQYYARHQQPAEAEKFSAAFARKNAILRKTPGQYAYLRARE